MSLTYRVATVFQHVQADPSMEWVIEHWQGGYPIVDVYVEVDGSIAKIIPASVTYNNPNQVTVGFTIPRSGFAAVA